MSPKKRATKFHLKLSGWFWVSFQPYIPIFYGSTLIASCEYARVKPRGTVGAKLATNGEKRKLENLYWQNHVCKNDVRGGWGLH
jgi:hypothetical protein